MKSVCGAKWVWTLALVVAGSLSVASSGAAEPSDNASDASSKLHDKMPVDLFDAMKGGDIDVKFIPHNSREGQLLVTNKTDQPLTVKLPEAFAAVPVLAQAVGAAGGNNANRKSYGNSNNNSQNQGVGGGGGGLGGNVGGGGAFDVAPEKVAKIKLETVCLEHGKKEPNAHVPYEIRPIGSFTSDANVQELCKMVGAGQIDQRAAQAAAWHLANHMTWEQLMDKKIHHLIGGDEVYFSQDEILAAMQITDRAMKTAEARATSSTSASSQSASASTQQNYSRPQP
jgi:hypothetical protein